mmetsp:Transcript_109177/g.198932  ORF Transcript_109177/g.198932 Transcript_109177/m.198932 type:complete len:734 (+) Transcript_109177:108-2309(+)
MTSTIAVVVFACLATCGGATFSTVEVENRVNPIRRVVTLLQVMQKKVTAEGEKEVELFDKFMCYCKTSGGDLDKSISLAEDKVPQVSADISESEEKLTQTKGEVKQAQEDRAAAVATMEEAKALRAKTASEFAKVNSDLSTNVAALGKAISALESGMAGSFLQSANVQSLRRLIVDRDMSDFDRQMIASFLDARQGYVPKSGQIVGILKQIKDSMSADLESATASEDASIKSFEGLMAAKLKEKAALTKAIEVKTEQVGQLGVDIVTMKDDLSDTQKALEEDKAFLAGLDKNCATKTAEHEENMKIRAEELVALADTIKVLNDDDALELFKKTLPAAGSASFMQVQERDASKRERALQMILSQQKQNPGSNPVMNFLVLALKGKNKKVDFSKVLKMIDELVVLLGKEQEDDDHQKEYCLLSFDTQDDKKKALEGDISALSATIEKEKDSIAALAEEIKALEAGIVALDSAVAEATEQRKDEHTEFEALMVADSASKDVLAWAKNRLNKFYNPELYTAPPKRVLSEEDKLYSTFGGDVGTTPAPPPGVAGTGVISPFAFAQISAHRQHKSLDDVAPPPPPETAAAYKKKSESSAGVLYMIDVMIKDLDKEMTEAKTAETEAQADYETTMAESAAKRATDANSLASKEAAKAATESDLLKHEDEKTATTGTLMATEEVIAGLHSECDWLLQNFETRKAARVGEVESLKNAKAVLSGADYSLAQLTSARHLRGVRA